MFGRLGFILIDLTQFVKTTHSTFHHFYVFKDRLVHFSQLSIVAFLWKMGNFSQFFKLNHASFENRSSTT